MNRSDRVLQKIEEGSIELTQLPIALLSVFKKLRWKEGNMHIEKSKKQYVVTYYVKEPELHSGVLKLLLGAPGFNKIISYSKNIRLFFNT